MASLRHVTKQRHLVERFLSLTQERRYASKIDWKELKPMILKRVRSRAKDYPIRRMVPVAEEVLRAREALVKGVSALLQIVPVKACKFCPEVYVGETGHMMKTCPGFKQLAKNLPHKWSQAQLIDVLVPVETYHLTDPFQPESINHDQRFDFTRIPAVLELCYQAGADLPEDVFDVQQHSCSMVHQEHIITSHDFMCHRANSGLIVADMEKPKEIITSQGLSSREISSLGNMTLEAWERLRLGVKKLLLVYNAKACQHCSEVHIGPSGHKVRTCGMYNFEAWRGAHLWKRAEVNDIVPEKIVWHRRPQDPIVLEDKGRGYYGQAPAVVEICSQAGARVPEKYNCIMKMHGLPPRL